MAKALKRIYLIRHGNSEGNADFTTYQHTPDHAINLTDEGYQQAVNAGKIFSAYYKKLIHQHPEVAEQSFRLWYSPYKRTRQTKQGFLEGLGENKNIIHSERENIVLAEQSFGLFDGLTEEEKAQKHPEMYKKFKMCEEHQGKFWAKPPFGESRYDVCLRVPQMFGTIIRDAEKEENPIENIIIVSHGTTLRAFTMQFLHKEFEWFEKEPNPNNCSIRMIGENANGKYEDKGYIFNGYKDQEAVKKEQLKEQSKQSYLPMKIPGRDYD